MQFREMLDQIKSAIKWFISPSEHLVYDGVYCKLIELEDRLRVLEEENIETTNELYRMENSLDARIDILVNEFKND
jgi:hypothetical protein